jgi:succinate dehydrogenase / fumarate reductase cytochrome b subunit
VNKKRPVNLDLTTIKFPLPAIVSILHRISGVILFLLIPLLIWILDNSLFSENSFDTVQAYANGWFIKLLIWLSVSALIYHLFAGVRHLLMDTGWGETLPAARKSAKVVIALTVIVMILLGIWLW